MGTELPRTPGVFDRKVKWKFSEKDPDKPGEWDENYPSAVEHAKVVR